MAEYMVLYIGVDDGEIAEVFEADELGKPGRKAEELNKRGESVTIQGVVTEKAITTLYIGSSPGCRYVHHACRWRRVCK